MKKQEKMPIGIMLGSHLLALPICGVVLFVGIVVGLFRFLGPADGDDANGPLVVPILIGICLMVAAAVTVFLAVVCLVLQVLIWNLQLSAWLPLLIALFAALTMSISFKLMSEQDWLVCLAAGAAIASSFVCYWVPLLGAQALIGAIAGTRQGRES